MHRSASPPNHYKYWAFIACSRHDLHHGKALISALERYRIPKAACAASPYLCASSRSIAGFFLDAEEIADSTNIGGELRKRLAESFLLIVIGSPHSAQSQWIGEEIRYFRQHVDADRVLCLIVDGEPNAIDKQLPPEQECFHPALQFDNEALDDTRQEPLASDCRSGRDEPRNAMLKLLAGIIQVRFRNLSQRDREYRLKHASVLMVAALLALAILLYGLVFWRGELDQRRTRRYLAALNTAEEAISRRNPAAARASLSAVPQTRRSTFVWRFLMQHCGCPISTATTTEQMTSAAGSYTAFDCSRDGRRVLAVSLHGEIVIYEARSLRVLHRMANNRTLRGARWLPGSDDVLVSGETTLERWDFIAGQAQFVVGSYNGGIRALDVMPPGDYAATLNEIGSVSIWELAKGEQLDTLVYDGHYPCSLTFSHDGRTLAIGYHNGEIGLWDTARWQLRTTLRGGPKAVTSVAFTPDDQRLLTGSDEGMIRVWNIRRARQVDTLRLAAPVQYALSISPDGRECAIAAGEMLEVWDLPAGCKVLAVPATPAMCIDVRFAPDGQRLFYRDGHGRIGILEAADHPGKGEDR